MSAKKGMKHYAGEEKLEARKCLKMTAVSPAPSACFVSSFSILMISSALTYFWL